MIDNLPAAANSVSLSSLITANNQAHTSVLSDPLNFKYGILPVNAFFDSSLPAQNQRNHLRSDNEWIRDRLTKLKSNVSPGTLSIPQSTVTAEQLYDARSSLKILTSEVAMHLNTELRDKLFFQIDSLHDIEEWDPDDKPVQKSSFKTFLKAILHINPRRHPGLGLSHRGNIIAAWTTNKDRLTIEFFANDQIRWVLAKQFRGEMERSASQGDLSRLMECLAPYSPESWFGEHA